MYSVQLQEAITSYKKEVRQMTLTSYVHETYSVEHIYVVITN